MFCFVLFCFVKATLDIKLHNQKGFILCYSDELVLKLLNFLLHNTTGKDTCSQFRFCCEIKSDFKQCSCSIDHPICSFSSIIIVPFLCSGC
jgi:hypothetical protein